jgi:hypothetical protein
MRQAALPFPLAPSPPVVPATMEHPAMMAAWETTWAALRALAEARLPLCVPWPNFASRHGYEWPGDRATRVGWELNRAGLVFEGAVALELGWTWGAVSLMESVERGHRPRAELPRWRDDATRSLGRAREALDHARGVNDALRGQPEQATPRGRAATGADPPDTRPGQRGAGGGPC